MWIQIWLREQKLWDDQICSFEIWMCIIAACTQTLTTIQREQKLWDNRHCSERHVHSKATEPRLLLQDTFSHDYISLISMLAERNDGKLGLTLLRPTPFKDEWALQLTTVTVVSCYLPACALPVTLEECHAVVQLFLYWWKHHLAIIEFRVVHSKQQKEKSHPFFCQTATQPVDFSLRGLYRVISSLEFEAVCFYFVYLYVISLHYICDCQSRMHKLNGQGNSQSGTWGKTSHPKSFVFLLTYQ